MVRHVPRGGRKRLRFRADGVFTTCITNITTLLNGTLCAAAQNERKRLRFRAEFAQPVDQADAQRRFIITYYTVSVSLFLK